MPSVITSPPMKCWRKLQEVLALKILCYVLWVKYTQVYNFIKCWIMKHHMALFCILLLFIFKDLCFIIKILNCVLWMLKGFLFFIFQDFPPETETLSKTFKAVVGAVHEDQVWNGLCCLFFVVFCLFETNIKKRTLFNKRDNKIYIFSITLSFSSIG